MSRVILEYLSENSLNKDLINSNNLQEYCPYHHNVSSNSLTFPKYQLLFIENYLNDNEMVYNESEGNVTCKLKPNQNVEKLIKLFYYLEISFFNFDIWYTFLEKEMKEEIIIIPLTEDYLKSLQRAYTNFTFQQPLQQVDLLNLKELMNKIERKLINKSKSYFIKLSTRSPKDNKYSLQKIEEKNLDNLTNEEIFKMKYDSLKCNKPSEMIDMLRTSKRVFDDISFYLEEKELFNYYNLNLIIREWIEDLEFDLEFRCFIFNGKVTAISQYQCFHVFERLQNENFCKEIADKIISFQQSIQNNLPFLQNYVMDIAYLPKKEQVHLIELNPFVQ
ncbi:hypothetical protein ABK040_013799 [Willaertia magna]